MTNDTTEAAALIRNYFELKSEIDALEAQADELRKSLGVLVTALGGSVKVDHLGSAIITPASTAHSYDTKTIDALIVQSVADGDIGTAKALTDARKFTTRKETLRITGAKS